MWLRIWTRGRPLWTRSWVYRFQRKPRITQPDERISASEELRLIIQCVVWDRYSVTNGNIIRRWGGPNDMMKLESVRLCSSFAYHSIIKHCVEVILLWAAELTTVVLVLAAEQKGVAILLHIELRRVRLVLDVELAELCSYYMLNWRSCALIKMLNWRSCALIICCNNEVVLLLYVEMTKFCSY
jgi:hypothetical protein